MKISQKPLLKFSPQIKLFKTTGVQSNVILQYSCETYAGIAPTEQIPHAVWGISGYVAV